MPATVIVGAQWGDEGKGKIVDLLAQHSDLVCRYQGGPNAGHTIVRHGETFKLHHVPSGILYGGKICVVGAGCVIDPGLLVRELDDLEERGISTEGLRISGNAHLIIRVQDILDAKILRQKFETALAEKNRVLDEPLQAGDLADRMESCAARLRPHIADTSLLVA